MGGRFHFIDWPLRAKMAALLVAASLVPLGIATWISVGNVRKDEYRTAERLLTARTQMLARQVDAANRSYLRVANLLALASPDALLRTQGTSASALQIRNTVHSQLRVWTAMDPLIRGVALLDAAGTVEIGTEETLEGQDMAGRSFVKATLAGAEVVSDLFLAETPVGETPTIAFLAPIRSADGVVLGAAAVWVNASYLDELLQFAVNAAGSGSYAAVLDGLGVRMAHSLRADVLYRAVGPLPPDVIEAQVAEQRFGGRTRALLEDVQQVILDPPISFDKLPDAGMYRVRSIDRDWALVVGQRCASTHWIAYQLIPESRLLADIATVVRKKLLFAAAIMVLALVVGVAFGAIILRPVRQLIASIRAVGAGALDTRVAVDRKDELGDLGTAFNGMAARIQEQSAALLRESEEDYRKLFQTMTEDFCIIEVIFDAAGTPVDFTYIRTNPAFDAHTGLDSVVGKRMSEVWPDLPAYWLEIYGRVAMTGEPVRFEDDDKPIGRYFDVRAYRVGRPETRRVAVLFNDITERKLALQRQAAQLESLHLLQQVTRAIGERQDLASIFQVVLRAIEERLPADFVCVCHLEAGRGLQVTHVGERSAALAGVMGMLEQTCIAIDANGLSRCVSGELVHEPDVGAVPFPFPQRLAAAGLKSLVAAPLLVENHVFGVLITARRGDGFSSPECEFLRQLSEHVALAAHHAQLYNELQTAYQDLRQSQQSALQQERLRALGQMASGIAHDINNAISPVALYTDSLLERELQLSNQGRDQLQTIQRAIHDVAATVERMREFYRVREPQLMLVPVQLNELVPQVMELTRARWGAMAQQRGVTIVQHTELQPGLPAILGAQNEIRDALTNLVFNAVDAMPQGGTLVLRTRTSHADQVLVEVCDTGIGMDEDSRRRCLEPFFTTKGERGTGLGLAMVYGMAQRHGAEIDIESAPGEGTTVRLAFRVAAELAVTEALAPVIVPASLRILIVDDDPVLLRSLRDILESDGHTVMAAGGGREGIELARLTLAGGQGFSVAITDLGMPHVDGRQVAQALKSMAPELPVILLTGWGGRLISEGDVPPEVDLILSKPPKLRTLREALVRICNS